MSRRRQTNYRVSKGRQPRFSFNEDFGAYLARNYGLWATATMNRITSAVKSVATDTQDWMKENAKWQDHSRAARNDLFSRWYIDSNRRVVLEIGYTGETAWDAGFYYKRKTGSEYYPLFLETMQGGKYAIVAPAMVKAKADLKARLK